MVVEIVSIGDELLIGQTINTNASWMGEKLSELGVFVSRVVTVRDTEDAIWKAIDEGMTNADIVFLTGGLGPTKDDITKKVITNYFEDELYIHEETLERVKGFFLRSNRPLLDVTIQQAAVPKKCTVLTNLLGTAPGMWLEKNQKIVISLPGIPYEMEGILVNEVFPRLKDKLGANQFYSKTGNIQGIGETVIADKMKEWENDLRNNGLELAYLPSTGYIRLRITSSKGVQDEQLIDSYFIQLQEAFPTNFYGYGEQTLQEVIGVLLKEKNATLATAESCSGGALAAKIVSIPGASDYFAGGFLTYTNALKHKILGVNNAHFETVGAVSEEVVLEMAKGCKELLNVDYAISISGIAGPDGGTTEKPVGTVWIGIASPNGVKAKKFIFSNNRERTIIQTVFSAMNLLRNELISN